VPETTPIALPAYG